mmetsp:Transcript_35731/g.85352  ORF Transcript_35731/g.85352 Transcript_35731/m.85352 type:complete len:205 (-) Transcript_35731:20-634(-)
MQFGECGGPVPHRCASALWNPGATGSLKLSMASHSLNLAMLSRCLDSRPCCSTISRCRAFSLSSRASTHLSRCSSAAVRPALAAAFFVAAPRPGGCSGATFGAAASAAAGGGALHGTLLPCAAPALDLGSAWPLTNEWKTARGHGGTFHALPTWPDAEAMAASSVVPSAPTAQARRGMAPRGAALRSIARRRCSIRMRRAAGRP